MNNIGDVIHQLINPEDALCLIKFSDGSETNDYVPISVIKSTDINIVDWWTEECGPDYRSIVEGKKKAISITEIKKN